MLAGRIRLSKIAVPLYLVCFRHFAVFKGVLVIETRSPCFLRWPLPLPAVQEAPGERKKQREFFGSDESSESIF